MNKWIKFGLFGALALAIVFAGVGVAAAQSDDPPFEPGEGPFGPQHRPGMGPQDGPMAEYHEVIDQALAEALGISLDEFEAARQEGEKLFELAEAAGVDLEELRVVMDEARAEVLEQALADGVITEEQFEWMQDAPGPRGPRPGGCHGDGPMHNGSGEFGPGGGRWGGRVQ